MPPEVTAQLSSLDRFRSYLVLLARWHWNPRLQGKLDLSDVVQQTLMAAWQGLPDFRGQTEAELRVWLRRILTRCLADLARDFGRDKRDVARERSLDAHVADSSARLEAWLDDQQSSPTERAERNEQLVQLAEALATLPDPQQEAITLHHLHGLSVNEIGQALGRSPAAVAGLLKRGLRTLRAQLMPGD
jgi:RNA polymerase sigma-70 factor (subfamily 1)